MTKKAAKTENKDVVDAKYEIAARIRAFRKDQNLTQRKLGEILGINFQHVSKYERGEFIPTFENLIKFNRHFSLNINWLLTGEGLMYLELNPENYKITEDQANQVIRDEDEILGEIIEVLRKNEKLKSAIYEVIKSFKNMNRASDQLQRSIEDLLLGKING
jgi:transcriptional regulator with XRE-family HTH domain